MFTIEELLKVANKKEHVNNVNAIKVGERIGKTPYIVEKTLYRGDLTFTYLVKNSVSNQKYIIKEFFPLSDFVYEKIHMSMMRTSDNQVVLKEATKESVRHYHSLKHRFKEEAECLKKLNKECHLVSVIETHLENNTCYMVLEYIPYPTLNALLKSKLLRPRQALALFIQIVDAVESIHKRGHIHKSINPNNIYITEKNVILGDYSVLNEVSGLRLNHASVYNDIFVAPEVRRYERVTKKSDVYSLGKVLEYLMEHIGYRSGNLRSVGMGEKFEPGKIDYLLRESTAFKPDERCITLQDMANITTHHVVNKNNRLEMLKLFLVGVLSLVAIFMVYRSNIFESFLKEDEVKALKSSEIIFQDKEAEFRVLTKKTVYSFGEPIILSWHDDELDTYNITIEMNDDTCCTNPMMVEGTSLDLQGLSLNPGRYTAVIKKSSSQVIYHDFRVSDGLILSDKMPPLFEYENYGFYSNEDMWIKWEGNSQSEHRLIVYDLQAKTILRDAKIKDQNVYLSSLGLTAGEYMVSIQSLLHHQQTIFDHTHVKVYSNEEIKSPVLLTKDHAYVTTEGFIEWLPLEGEVHVKLFNLKTDQITSTVFYQGEDSMALETFELSPGDYKVSLFHILKDRSSLVVNKTIVIMAK